MGSGLKKKKANPMGDYLPSEEERKAHVWCINNYIHMWPKPTTKGNNATEWWVEIQINKGQVNRSPEAYGPGDIWKQIYSYYLYYYEKAQKERKLTSR